MANSKRVVSVANAPAPTRRWSSEGSLSRSSTCPFKLRDASSFRVLENTAVVSAKRLSRYREYAVVSGDDPDYRRRGGRGHVFPNMLPPEAAAIALLRHDPSVQIELLRRALRLSHPGAVRLVDRIVVDGMVERRQGAHDRRAVALHLTEVGERSCTAIFAAHLSRIRQALETFDASERKTFARLAEKLLAGFIRDGDHGYSVCRLCDAQACTKCPVACAPIANV